MLFEDVVVAEWRPASSVEAFVGGKLRAASAPHSSSAGPHFPFFLSADFILRYFHVIQ